MVTEVHTRVFGGGPRQRPWTTLVVSAVTLVLIGLGLANIVVRSTFDEVEDGVLWVQRGEGVAAADVAGGSAGARAGLAAGDVLLAIDGQAVTSVDDVTRAQHAARTGQRARYSVLRPDAQAVVEVVFQPVANGSTAIYFALAAVGLFTLLVGAAVRLRRPNDPATLHFYWLTVAFFGVFTFSFAGRLDRLDWAFYWADHVSQVLLPPLFLHFAMVFPARPAWFSASRWRPVFPVSYLPAFLLGGALMVVMARGPAGDPDFERHLDLLSRATYLHLGVYLTLGVAVFATGLLSSQSPTALRQLRWIGWGTALGGLPFAFAHALPLALGFDPAAWTDLCAIPLGLVPLAYASAIARYRLMDVEIIVKRTLVYVAAITVIVAVYGTLLQVIGHFQPGGTTGREWLTALVGALVALVLAPPIKAATQNAFERAFYRDRLDYRRALVGFARDLNQDLDLASLSARLVGRVAETLQVERTVLMLISDDGRSLTGIHDEGMPAGSPPVVLDLDSPMGRALAAGQVIALDDPAAVARFPVEDVDAWRDRGLLSFIPCVAADGITAAIALGQRERAELLTSEDLTLLVTVAGQIATAIENARLYRQLQTKAAEIDRLREFNEGIVESLESGLLVLDLDERVVSWNHAIGALYGMSREQAQGRLIGELFDAPVVDAIRAARAESPIGATLSRVPLTTRRDGDDRRLLVNVTVVPLRPIAGATTVPQGTLVLVENITGRVRLEEQLQISEKMASIGLLAAGVAHEVNTPLTGISSYTQMLLEGAEAGDPRRAMLEKIEKQTFRASRIVNSLLSLARRGGSPADVSPVDVNRVITDVLALLEHQLAQSRITVRRELAADPVVVMGAEYQLQQVLLNLVLNARDAMSTGGWLTVSTRQEENRVIVEVSDTGAGIRPEHLARIYDPFFTTKSGAQGTGLGLSIAYGIVQDHAGTLACTSTEGTGTRFTITLPAVEAGQARASVKVAR